MLDDELLGAGDLDSETVAKVAPSLDRTISLQQELRAKVVECIAQDA
jgi:hypothetical protein